MFKNLKSRLFVESHEYNEKNKNDTMRNFHYHEHYEIYYLISGKCKYLINSNVYNIDEGDIVLIAKRDLHMATRQPDVSCERIVINFDDSFISEFDEDFKTILDCFKVNHIKFPMKLKKNINSLFAKILREYNSKEFYSEALCKNYICELLVTIYRYIYSEQVIPFDNDTSGSIDKAIRYIYNNYQKDLSLTEIANICHMNPSYFSRLFKKTTGINLVSYINTIRIKNASSLLADTDMTILEVAQTCGFDNPQHFCEIFKKTKGVSARQFRKEYKIKESEKVGLPQEI